MPEKDITFLSYLWGLLSLPLGWLWARQTSTIKLAVETKNELSDYKEKRAASVYTKPETDQKIIDKIEPIHTSITNIEKNIDILIQNSSNRREGD